MGKVDADVVEELTATLRGKDLMSAPKRMMVRRAAALEADFVHTEVDGSELALLGASPSH